MPTQSCRIQSKQGRRWKRSLSKKTKRKTVINYQRISSYPACSNHVHNARRLNSLKIDPTRSITLRKQFVAEVNRRFNNLKRKVLDLVTVEDVFGLKQSTLVNQFYQDAHGRPSAAIRGYDHAWRKFRSEYLEKHPWCALCLREGIKTKATTVDHIHPYRKNQKRFTDRRNWRSLCQVCHARKSGQERYRRKGMRVSDEEIQNVFYPTGKEGSVENAGRFQFLSTALQIEQFLKLLRGNILLTILNGEEANEDDWWNEYIRQGYEKGAGRAFVDTKAKRWGPHEGDFYQGTKDQFLRSSFAQPVSQEKLKLLTSRVFSDLRGVTDQMATVISRTLSDGLVQGLNPRVIGRNLATTIDKIGRVRANMIARTEIIRAHAEGQLDAMEQLGVVEVGVMVEWATAGDARVCPLCSALDDVVMKIREARGLLPRHANCRCAWVPANVGEDKSDQIRTKARIESAVSRSVSREGKKDKQDTTWPGADVKVSKKRPTSILENVFCPTGKGGGVDPSCGKGGGSQYSIQAKRVLEGVDKSAEAHQIFAKVDGEKNIPQYGRWPSREVEVPIKSLIATQSTIRSDQMLEVAEYAKGIGKKDDPEVFVSRGKMYIGDGHHRIALKVAQDSSTIKVRMFSKGKFPANKK